MCVCGVCVCVCVYIMFYYEIPWFCQDFNSKNLHFFKSVLSLRSENTEPVTRDHVKSFEFRNETPLHLLRLFLHVETGIIPYQ